MKQYGILARSAAAALAAFMALGLAACGSKQAAPEPYYAGEEPRAQALHGNANGNANAISLNPTEAAAHLEDLARRIEGVKDANCVVFGKYAVVGIDVDEKMERTEVGTLKYAVAEAFRKDPYGIDALVTADIDMGQRLREIRADVMNGKPISGFADEMADIVGRLVPQIPRNIIPPKSPENLGNRTP